MNAKINVTVIQSNHGTALGVYQHHKLGTPVCVVCKRYLAWRNPTPSPNAHSAQAKRRSRLINKREKIRPLLYGNSTGMAKVISISTERIDGS